MSELPQGWVEVHLREVCDVLDSWRVPLNAKERLQRPGDVPYYGATGRVGWVDQAMFNEELVLLGEDGAPFLDADKPKAYIIDGPSWVNNHAHVLRARSATSNRFLRYALDAADYGPYVNGTTRLKLTQAAMRSILLLLPPLAEQERIVAAVEEQFSRLDDAERLLSRPRELATRMRAAVLADLVRGHWPQKRIDEFAVVGSGATPRRGRPGYYEHGTVPWVTSGQLVNSFVIEPTTYITEEALRDTSVRLWPKNTLLVAMYGEGRTRGHCSELLFESTTNQACAAIVVADDAPVRRSFLKVFLAASYEKNRLLASGGVQPNLSLGLIRSLSIPVPPLDQQDRIVADVESLISIVQALKSAIDHALTRSGHLRRSILRRAFTGQLVPQDPDDEPASALLARIAAERPTQSKPPRRERA